MLISYNRPADIAWSLIGDGSAWLSDDAGAALTNGRPAAASRLQWLSGDQTTGSVLILRGTWGTAFAPRLVGLVGLTLPVGTLISLAFRRPDDDGYTYLADEPQQRVVQLPDGSRCAWFVLDDGLDAVIGLEFHIANDVNGAASIAAGAAVDIGEAWVGPTVLVPHEKGWRDSSTDPSVTRRSLGSQIFTSARPAYRALKATLAFASLAQVRGGALANGMDWQLLRGALAGNAQVAGVMRYDSPAEIQRTAIFGAGTMDDISQLTGPYYSSAITLAEAPAVPA